MTSPRSRRASALALLVLQRYGLVVLFAAALVGFSAALPNSFPTAANLRNLAGSQSVLAILSLALLLPLVSGHIDLSFGAVLTMTSIVTAWLLSHGVPLAVAAPAAVVAGATVGWLNGTLIATLGLNALITTLGTASVIIGGIAWQSKGQSIINGIPASLTAFGSGTWLGVPSTLYFLVAVALLVAYLLGHTPFGRHLHAVGANPEAARLLGLDVAAIVRRGFVVEGALIGVAGVLLVARQGGSNPQIGPTLVLQVLSAAFLGATTITPGAFNVLGTLVAVFFVAASVSGLALADVGFWVEPIFNGVALVGAVALSSLLGRRVRARSGRA